MMNTKRLILVILLIFLGILIAVGPYTLFPVCGEGKDDSSMGMSMSMSESSEQTAEAQATTTGYMRCHWTAQAERGIGLVIAVLGALLLLPASSGFLAGISTALALNGMLAALIPTVLIGVCGNAHASCYTLAKPALIICGVSAAVLGAGYALCLYGRAKK